MAAMCVVHIYCASAHISQAEGAAEAGISGLASASGPGPEGRPAGAHRA